MARLAVWEFGEGEAFDGSRLYAEVSPEDVGQLRHGTLEVTVEASRMNRATIVSHGVPGRDIGAFAIVMTHNGAISLTCTDGAGSPFRLRTPEGFAAPHETIQITLATQVAGGAFTVVNCTRRKTGPHDPAGGHIEALPIRARIDLRGTHNFTFGAASGGIAPFFAGRILRATLSDTTDAPTVPPPSAKVHRLRPSMPDHVAPRRIAAAARLAEIAAVRNRRAPRPGLRGMRITTSEGEKPLPRLEPGDEVLTRDHGFQRVRWAGRVEIGWKMLNARPELRPVIVRKGTLGKGLPEADLILSQGQRLIIAKADCATPFGAENLLTPARRLLGPGGHEDVEAIGVSYFHFFCNQHELVQINGVWVEAFHPGRAATGPGAEVRRREIFELFPELASRLKPVRT